MYDIMNLNIWKEPGLNVIFRYKEIILEVDAAKRKESVTSMKCQEVFYEMMELVPTADFEGIKKRSDGRLRFPMYINERLKETDLEALELSTRSNNCLHRAGFRTIGELVEHINSSDDLKHIKNCGTKSINEIMEKLLCYQYQILDHTRKVKYINRVLELNNRHIML